MPVGSSELTASLWMTTGRVLPSTFQGRTRKDLIIGGFLLCITSEATALFSSYLTIRKKFVGINESSCLVNLDVEVPQGSVLGPLLYLLYTSHLADVVKCHNVSYHFYAHDSQLYLSFRGNQQLLRSRRSLEQCLTDISLWMLANGLKLNHESID